jgi:hypothetical protein
VLRKTKCNSGREEKGNMDRSAQMSEKTVQSGFVLAKYPHSYLVVTVESKSILLRVHGAMMVYYIALVFMKAITKLHSHVNMMNEDDGYLVKCIGTAALFGTTCPPGVTSCGQVRTCERSKASRALRLSGTRAI